MEVLFSPFCPVTCIRKAGNEAAIYNIMSVGSELLEDKKLGTRLILWNREEIIGLLKESSGDAVDAHSQAHAIQPFIITKLGSNVKTLPTFM